MSKIKYLILLCIFLLMNGCKKTVEKASFSEIIGTWKIKTIKIDSFNSEGKLSSTSEMSSDFEEWVFTDKTAFVYYADVDVDILYNYDIKINKGKTILSLYKDGDDKTPRIETEIKSINSFEMSQLHPCASYSNTRGGVTEHYTCTKMVTYYKVK